METRSGDFELTTDELRAVAAYAVACAEPALVIFQKAHPDDPRPAAALQAARVFAEGAPRSRLQRTAAADAHRAARDAATEPARHAASAAGDAAAAAYLHPLAKATQVRHILGSAAHAARAAELARGDDPVVAEYVITAAAKRATPVVLDVLARYPRAPKGRNRIAVLMQRLDSLLRDPPPTPRVVDDPGPFFHGTRADVRPGDLLTPGWRSNYGSQRQSNHIYLTATREGAPLAAELARGEGPDGSTGSSPSARSRTTPTSPTSASPATRPAPTGRPSRCGSSRRSRAGSVRTRRWCSTCASGWPSWPSSGSRRWTTDGGSTTARSRHGYGTRMARPRTRPASRSSIASLTAPSSYVRVCMLTLPAALRAMSLTRSL